MASNAIAIGGKPKGKKKPTVSQSIPAHFYRNYVPPKTPKINAQPAPNNVPDFEALPKISGGVGINLQKSGSYSMNKNRHPMSMPATSGLMMGPRGTPFTVSNKSFTKNNDKASKEPELSEHKEEQLNEQLNDDGNSLVERTQNLKIGSFTCLDMMGGGASKLVSREVREDHKGDVASQTSQATASTFASDPENEVAPEPESDEDGAEFDMD